MKTINQLRIFLWAIDPGYFRLKQALKTVLAILITLLLLQDELLFIKVMGCLACGFSMQGIVAKSFRFKILHVIFFDFTYYAVFLLGFFVRDLPNVRALVLIVLGFVVNYMRRFNLQNSVAPLMVWMLCFIATVLPFNSSTEALSHIDALVLGLVVGSVVFLFVFPDNYPRLFINNSNRMHKLLAKGMQDIRRYLIKRSAQQNFEGEEFVRIKNTLNELLDSNQAMEQSEVFLKRQKIISEVLIHQYGLIHAYGLMIEAYRILKIHHYQLSPAVRLGLSTINRHFYFLFQSLTMNNDYSLSAKAACVSIHHLSAKLSQEQLSEPKVVMAILNLKLSFNLLNHHIMSLLRGTDGN